MISKMRLQLCLLLVLLLAIERPGAAQPGDVVVNLQDCGTMAGLQRMVKANFNATILSTTLQFDLAVAGASAYIAAAPLASILLTASDPTFTLNTWGSITPIAAPQLSAFNPDIVLSQSFSSLSSGNQVLSVPAGSATQWRLMVVDTYGVPVLSITSKNTSAQYLFVSPDAAAALNIPEGFTSGNMVRPGAFLLVAILQIVHLGAGDAATLQSSFGWQLLASPSTAVNTNWQSVLIGASRAFSGDGDPLINLLMASSQLISQSAPQGTSAVQLAKWAALGFNLRKPIARRTFVHKIPSVLLGAQIGAACAQIDSHPLITALSTRWTEVEWTTHSSLALQQLSALNAIYQGSWPAPNFQEYDTNFDAMGRPMQFPYNYTFEVSLPPTVLAWSLTMYDASTNEMVLGSDNKIAQVSSLTPGMVEDAVTGAVIVNISPFEPTTDTANWIPVPTGIVFKLIFRLYGAGLTANSAASSRRLLPTTAYMPPSVGSPNTDAALLMLGTGYNLLTGCPVWLCQVGVDAGMTYNPIFALATGDHNSQDQSGCISFYQVSTSYSSYDRSTTAALSVGATVAYGPVSFGSSASFTSASSSSTASNSVSLSALSQCVIETAGFSATPAHLNFTPGFLREATNLINSIGNAASFQAELQGWLVIYGTHYIQTVQFGGFINFAAEMSAQTLSTMNSNGNSWSATAGAHAVTATTGGSSNVINTGTSGASSYTSTMKVLPTNIPLPTSTNGSVDFTTWSQNLASSGSRTPVAYTITEIATLFDNPRLFPGFSASSVMATAAGIRAATTNCASGSIAKCLLKQCVAGSYQNPSASTNSQLCVACSDRPLQCNGANTASCTTTACTCISGWTGATCNQKNFGDCSFKYSFFKCHLNYNHCVAPNNYRIRSEYFSGSGCKGQCCDNNGVCGCGTDVGRWCN